MSNLNFELFPNREEKLVFSEFFAMRATHDGAAAPVTASATRQHGGPAGVCASASARASKRARALRPHPPKKPTTPPSAS